MKDIVEIKRTDCSNFNESSMDSFDRFQEVRNVYRPENGKLVLKWHPFTEDWSHERKREKAEEILSGRYITYCAFAGNAVVGAILLTPEMDNGRLIIDSFHVSREFRRRGIGRKLFEAAAEYAKSHGADALYASCCSAEETIDFYMAMGFRPSEQPIPSCVENEPFDIQMECKLNMIETNRLKIYSASQEQMTALIAAESNDVLKAAYTEMLNGCLAHPDQWEWYAIWMIELKDGTHIGDICFKGITENGSAEIGYGIAEDYQGQGYATEAVSALVDWALNQPGVTRVMAETEEANAASQRVLKKVGFVPTGEKGEDGPLFVRRK